MERYRLSQMSVVEARYVQTIPSRTGLTLGRRNTGPTARVHSTERRLVEVIFRPSQIYRRVAASPLVVQLQRRRRCRVAAKREFDPSILTGAIVNQYPVVVGTASARRVGVVVRIDRSRPTRSRRRGR